MDCPVLLTFVPNADFFIQANLDGAGAQSSSTLLIDVSQHIGIIRLDYSINGGPSPFDFTFSSTKYVSDHRFVYLSICKYVLLFHLSRSGLINGHRYCSAVISKKAPVAPRKGFSRCKLDYKQLSYCIETCCCHENHLLIEFRSQSSLVHHDAVYGGALLQSF
jgi:hypothetical protein